MSRYILGVEADIDLDEIWEYIAQDSIDAADSWMKKLFAAFESLDRNPGNGHSRKDLTDLPILFWPVGAYLVLYRVQASRIEIVAVTQGARDIPSFLRQRLLGP